MIAALVFVCAAIVAHGDCNESTALRTIDVPGTFGTRQQCTLGSAQWFASQAKLWPKEDEYVVYWCGLPPGRKA